MSSKELSKKYWVIWEEEDQFVRTLAIYIRSRLPQPRWHLLIPFKFLHEYFATKRLGRDLAQNVMYFKELALGTAYRLHQSEDRESLFQEMRDKLQQWLERQNLHTDTLLEKQFKLAQEYVDHYYRLLGSSGKKYHEILKNAYPDHSEYQAFLDRVQSLEKDIDNEVYHIASPRVQDADKLEQNLGIKQESMREVRDRDVRRTYFK